MGKGFIDFLYDRWLLDVSLVDMASIGDLPHMLVAEFYGDASWSTEVLKFRLLMHLVRQVQEIQLFPHQDDTMVWLDSSTGDFSIKSAWESLW